VHTRYIVYLSLFICLFALGVSQSDSADGQGNPVPPVPIGGAHINLIVVDATINPAVADFIRESIDQASKDGALALIIQFDTPGGLLTSTKTIVKDLLDAPLPVIVYVAPGGSGAISAGVFITMAGAIAAMAPGTTIGAAHPVAGGGQNIEGDMREKVENFTASFSESIAQRRGRNVEWAEKAVRESVVITETEALEKKVIDLVATDVQDLLRQVGDRTVEIGSVKQKLDFSAAQGAGGAFRVVTQEMRLKHKVLNILAHPQVAYLLMMAGILGLYLEFSNPGLLFPGLAGAICLLIALTAFQVLPINYTGLLLILLGIALLVTELFVPSFGILGVSGIVAFVMGSLFLFDSSDAEFAIDRSIIFTVALCAGVFMLIVGTLSMKAYRLRPVTGKEGMMGEVGEVRVRLAPRGKVWLHGEYWNAETEEEEIEAGQPVRVVEINHMVLKVHRASW
jgi:membrane-bound serine protease (ClpP class)